MGGIGALTGLSTMVGATTGAREPEIQLDGTAITLIRRYEGISLRGLSSQDEFEIRFGQDARGRMWYSIAPEDSSMHAYRPLDIYRKELRATHLERIIVDTVEFYLNHQQELSREYIICRNEEFYRTLKNDLLGGA